MKKVLKFATLVVCVVLMASCGGQKTVADSKPKKNGPFSGGTEAPCTVYDDDQYFTAVGIASGPATQKGTLQKTALANGQDFIRAKMQHAYEGSVKTYFEHIGANKGSDVETQTIGGGNQMIMAIVNNTSHSCLMWSDVDDRGNMECYVAIKISKNKVADAIADNLLKSEKEDIRNRANEFRKQLKEDVKNYKAE